MGKDVCERYTKKNLPTSPYRLMTTQEQMGLFPSFSFKCLFPSSPRLAPLLHTPICFPHRHLDLPTYQASHSTRWNSEVKEERRPPTSTQEMGQEGEATAPVVAVEEEEEEIGGRGGERGGTGEESCDFCGAARALLSCRADAARLCLACDRHVHAANTVSSRHRRALLCDACRSEPSAIHCSSCRALLCANCDFDAHGRAGLLHDRRPVEGFSGCPSAGKLVSALGVGGDEKEVLEGEGDDVGDYLVEDVSVWEAQPVLSLEDFIVPTTASHGFQAMGMPPLPKVCESNRNWSLCAVLSHSFLEFHCWFACSMTWIYRNNCIYVKLMSSLLK